MCDDACPDVLLLARRLVSEADRADLAQARVRELESLLTTDQPPLVDPRRGVIIEWVRTRTSVQRPGTPGRELYQAFLADTGTRADDLTEVLFGRTLTRLGHPSEQIGGYWFRPLAVVVTPSAPYATRGA